MNESGEPKWLQAFREYLKEEGDADEVISGGYPVTINGILSELRCFNPESNAPLFYENVPDEYKPKLIELVEQFCHDREWTWDHRKNPNDLPCILSIEEVGED